MSQIVHIDILNFAHIYSYDITFVSGEFVCFTRSLRAEQDLSLDGTRLEQLCSSLWVKRMGKLIQSQLSVLKVLACTNDTHVLLFSPPPQWNEYYSMNLELASRRIK